MSGYELAHEHCNACLISNYIDYRKCIIIKDAWNDLVSI